MRPKWIKLPNRTLVSTGRVRKYGSNEILTTQYPTDVTGTEYGADYSDAYLREAEKHGLEPDKTGDPLNRFVKECTLIARQKGDSRRLPRMDDHLQMLLYTACANQMFHRHIYNAENEEAGKLVQPTLFYEDTITNAGISDTVAEFLELHGKNVDGDWIAVPYVFDENGNLQQAGSELTVASDGWIRVIGPRGFPIETSKERGPIEEVGDAFEIDPECRVFAQWEALDYEGVNDRRVVSFGRGHLGKASDENGEEVTLPLININWPTIVANTHYSALWYRNSLQERRAA
jgi:hypothetical protein